ncbi:hypothetical protein BDZ89DRAFT_1167270 [Hymenopellis radicata]|nr:hypothetical protein BDZ89DRAFT_1167270 [Hymenopellis radicata]
MMCGPLPNNGPECTYISTEQSRPSTTSIMPSPFLSSPFLSSPLRNEILFTPGDEELGQSVDLTNETPLAVSTSSVLDQAGPSAWLLSFTLDADRDDSGSDYSEEEDEESDDTLPSTLVCSVVSELSDLSHYSDDDGTISEDEEEDEFLAYDWVSGDDFDADNEDGEAWDEEDLQQIPLVLPEEF